MSESQKISITRALSEIKTIDARLQTKLSELNTVTISISDKLPNNTDLVTFNKKALADYQSYTDLVDRKNRLKAAIVASNAVTKVTIGGQEMTVAAAIEMKSSVEYLRSLATQLRKQFLTASRSVEHHNNKAQEQLQQLLVANFGKDRKATEEEQNAITAPFLRNNQAVLIDPLGATDKASDLLDKVTTFENEVDFVLSESNAVTKVEV